MKLFDKVIVASFMIGGCSVPMYVILSVILNVGF